MKSPSSTRAAFGTCLRQATPFNLVVMTFTHLPGVPLTNSGWDLLRTPATSVVVIVGASRFAALHLIEDCAPFVEILPTDMAVKLRMAVYSAALAPDMGEVPLWQRALSACALSNQFYDRVFERISDYPRWPASSHHLTWRSALRSADVPSAGRGSR